MRNFFVDNPGVHLRRYSVIALGLILAVEPTWAAIPEDLRARLPDWLKDGVQLAIAAGGLIGAFLKQPLARSAFGLPPLDGGSDRP